MRRWAARWAAIAAVGLGAASCTAILGLDFDPTRCAAGQTACPDACVDLSADPRSCGACGHDCGSGTCKDGTCQPGMSTGGAGGGAALCGKTYPDPPGGTDSPVDNTFVVALHTIHMGEGEPEPPGYDPDHQCTCVDDAAPTCAPRLPNCDAPDGVDNAAAKLINLISISSGGGMFGSSYFSSTANGGSWTMLIQVSGYNGMANDPAVDVALFASVGTMGVLPNWDGNDAWPVSATSVMDGDATKPLIKSKGAYVTDHVLVVAVPSVPLTIMGANVRIAITLTAGVITGTLQSQGNGWHISGGIIAARWHEPDIFGALSSYRNNDGKPFCTDAAISYATAKSTLCNSLDILKDASGPKSLPCDSLSMGIGFEADPALLGVVTLPPTPTPGCPMATDPQFDDCSK